MSILKGWPWPPDLQPSPGQSVRKQIADDLTIRVVLTRLERVLGELRHQLTTLEPYELEAARLGSVMPCLGLCAVDTLTPGPLGPRVIGFAFQRHGDGRGALTRKCCVATPTA